MNSTPTSHEWAGGQASPEVFYHVAAIGHWKEIVSEQLGLFKRGGFTGKIHIGFIGQPFEDGFLRRVADSYGLDVEIRLFGNDMRQFEFPTLNWMHETCQSGADRPVLYIHGKAVSNTKWQWTMWRWIMNAYCISQWREMVKSLAAHNCAGVSWHGNAFPVSYFPGNFWWARSDFVKQLTAMDEYVRQFEECISHKNPNGFTRRHAAECWVNSRVNAVPSIFGPLESRFWDHAWWTAVETQGWVDMAYRHGH